MSYDARMWARRQVLRDSSAKHLLKTFADWAAEDYTVWVSNSELVADTEMNSKTVSKYIGVLVDMGYLRDTGMRQGRTRQIVVFQMTAPACAITVQTHDPRTREVKTFGPPNVDEWDAKADQKRKASKNGGVKDTQERKPSKNGSLPKLDGKPPKFGAKAPQKRTESPPKTVDDKVYGLREGLEGDARAGAQQTSHTPKGESDNPEPQLSAFDRFWDAWPSASGRKQSMEVCRSHWHANALDDHAEVIIAHVRAMKLTQHWKTGGDPTPIRYLEQKRWRDGMPTEPTADAVGADTGTRWFEGTTEQIDARAAQLGVRARRADEPIAWYRVLVAKESREKAAIDFVLKDAKRFNSLQLFDFAVQQFGGELLPADFQ